MHEYELVPLYEDCREFWTPIAYGPYGNEVAWLCEKHDTVHHSREHYCLGRHLDDSGRTIQPKIP